MIAKTWNLTMNLAKTRLINQNDRENMKFDHQSGQVNEMKSISYFTRLSNTHTRPRIFYVYFCYFLPFLLTRSRMSVTVVERCDK